MECILFMQISFCLKSTHSVLINQTNKSVWMNWYLYFQFNNKFCRKRKKEKEKEKEVESDWVVDKAEGVRVELKFDRFVENAKNRPVWLAGLNPKGIQHVFNVWLNFIDFILIFRFFFNTILNPFFFSTAPHTRVSLVILISHSLPPPPALRRSSTVPPPLLPRSSLSISLSFRCEDV